VRVHFRRLVAGLSNNDLDSSPRRADHGKLRAERVPRSVQRASDLGLFHTLGEAAGRGDQSAAVDNVMTTSPMADGSSIELYKFASGTLSGMTGTDLGIFGRIFRHRALLHRMS
jgi:hypothetical protein